MPVNDGTTSSRPLAFLDGSRPRTRPRMASTDRLRFLSTQGRLHTTPVNPILIMAVRTRQWARHLVLLLRWWATIRREERTRDKNRAWMTSRRCFSGRQVVLPPGQWAVHSSGMHLLIQILNRTLQRPQRLVLPLQLAYHRMKLQMAVLSLPAIVRMSSRLGRSMNRLH
ncbi:hypothetical protein BJX76DRAFT_337944 [Aspergillus varians]